MVLVFLCVINFLDTVFASCGWRQPSLEDIHRFANASWRKNRIDEAASVCDIDRISAEDWDGRVTKPTILFGGENVSRLSYLLSREQLHDVFGDIHVAPKAVLGHNDFLVNAAYFQEATVPFKMFVDLVLARKVEQVVDNVWWSRHELSDLRRSTMSILINIISKKSHLLNSANNLSAILNSFSSAIDVHQKEMLSSYAYLGAAGTGAAFHRHGVAFNALACGAKRWWFAPPNHFENVVGLRPLRGTNSVDDEERCPSEMPWLRECIQRQGEIVIVPNGVPHATVNIQESVGIAFVPGGHA